MLEGVRLFAPQAVSQLEDSPVALRQVFNNARQTTIPMVGIRQKPGAEVRGDDVQGIATLRRLLARRSFARAVDEARPYRPLFPLGAPDRD